MAASVSRDKARARNPESNTREATSRIIGHTLPLLMEGTEQPRARVDSGSIWPRVGVERPLMVGHSWGAIVALTIATRHQADTAGLILISRYYLLDIAT
jgi:predicted esterase